MYVFTFDNLRSTHMADVRRRFRDGRTFLGKNKVAQVALGRSESEAYAPQTNLVSDHLLGQCGLLFTHEPEEDVIRSAGTSQTSVATHPRTRRRQNYTLCILPCP
jgi:mRNA turnover protein 4